MRSWSGIGRWCIELAYQFAGNHHDAEDIAQDVFIKVYRSLDRFRYDAQLTSWLYRIVMNACIDHRRRQSPAGWAPFTEEAELQMVNTPEEGPGPEEQAYGGQLGEVLDAEIARLPPGQRLVFTMRHHEGLKLSEIASRAGSCGRHGETSAARGGAPAARRVDAARASRPEGAHERLRAVDADVELYFYGELEPAERARVAAHLRGCAECRQRLEELQAIRRALASRPAVDAPPGGRLVRLHAPAGRRP